MNRFILSFFGTVRRSVCPFLVLLWLTFALRPSSFADELRDAVRDGTGCVWAITRNGDLDAVAGDGQLRTVPLPVGENRVQALCLGRRADGSVLCLWHRGGQDYVCTEHRGKDSRVLAPFSIDEGKETSNWHLKGDSVGSMWLTHQGAGIYRLRPDGAAECLRRVTPDECLNATSKPGPATFTEWNLISVCEDGGGRTWFWTDRADCASTNGTIRGALVYDGSAFVQHDFNVTGADQKAITALAPKDAGHLWCARLFDGVYILDTATFQAERAPGQPKEAAVTLRILNDGRATWAVTYGRGSFQRQCALWRLPDADDSGGATDLPPCPWEKMVEPLDTDFDYQSQQDRIWATTAEGSFLGSYGHGLWFLPRDRATPFALDWQRRFPLFAPRRFVELGDGGWLGIGHDGQTWAGSPGAFLSSRASFSGHPLRARVLRTSSPLFPDDRGRVWNAFSNRGPSLREWTGNHWTEHPPPTPAPGRTNDGLTVLNTDAHGRVWVRMGARIDGKQVSPVLLYDPSLDRWQEFPGFDAALETYAKQDGSGAAFMEAPANGYDMPQFGEGGRVGYLLSTGNVAAFNGQHWRQWTREEIAGKTKNQSFGPPFFNRAGRMRVDIDYQTWEADADITGWKTIPYEEGYHEIERTRNWREYVPPFTFRGKSLAPDSAAQDNTGAWWVTSGNTLYRARDQWCVPAFAPDEPHPFIDGRRLERAFIDAHGNTLLYPKIDSGGHEAVILAPAGSLPRTTLTVQTGTAPDQRTVRLATDAAPIDGRTRFRWRLDGGAWNAVDTDGSDALIALDALRDGAHRVEACSIDAELQTDAAPAVVAFEVRVDTQAQLARLIAQLGDADFDRRKAAVEALAHQPETALPALRAARLQTAAEDADRRWWIDAAIQRAEFGR